MSSDECKQTNIYNREIIFKSLICGGIAGMASKTSVAPFERVKILLQGHHHTFEADGVLSGLKHVIRQEGFLALYKGNGAQMLQVFPYSATQFTAFEVYKRILDGVFPPASHFDKFLAGAGAGMTAIFLTYPMDLIRARMTFQVQGEHVYTGITHAVQSIFREEGGPKGFYRGLLPTLISKVPQAGLTFYCFEYLKFACKVYIPDSEFKPCDEKGRFSLLAIPARLACGGVASAAAEVISYPLDVTRRNMQLSTMNPNTHEHKEGMLFSLRKVYREHGLVKGLYRGMTINFLRAIPMVLVSFTTYEICKEIMDLDLDALSAPAGKPEGKSSIIIGPKQV